LEPKASYTIVGLSVLILTATLLSTLLWFSVGFERKTYKFYTVYTYESVAGLGDASAVKFNGVNVGAITAIELDPNNPQRIWLTLKIETDVPITVSTRATLIMQGITGTTYLALTATTPSLVPIKTISGEPYPVIPYKPSFFSRLEKNIAAVSKSVNRIFDKENAELLTKSLRHLESLSDTLAKNNQNLNQSLQDLPIIMRDLKDAVNAVTKASKQVTDTMKTGKQSITQFTQQTLPPATTLLRKLDNIATNLEQVSRSMRENPSVLLRGSAPPHKGPGE